MARRARGSGRVIGVDTGGTFTDLVLDHDGEERAVKVPSTPADPAEAVLAGLAELGGVRPGDHIVLGTTVALNALLTGNVARAALVTGVGFRDLLEIGRQDRPDIYALHPVKPAPLVPRARRFEIAERSWPDPETGAIVAVRTPSADELAELRERVRRSGAESVAICLLHSWAAPEIEERVGAALADLGLPLSLSSRILPAHREVERFSTAAVNAVLVPVVRAHLAGLARRLGGARLSVLQSNGGALPAEAAALEPVRILLSGPAGGVVGAARAAREAGLGAGVTLDMGGTSTDVAFSDPRTDGSARGGRHALEPLSVAGHPVAVPALDIHTIGCGGGSLVLVDAGGALHVGPESAGADPGPVCYGKSLHLAVTDAHVLLGHLAQGAFLGGRLALDVRAVERAFASLGRRLGVSPARAAAGVLEIARSAMRRAVGVMTMQRGVDPRREPLIAFGGAGGLHAAALAQSLGMPCALVPSRPGLLSAWGMAGAGALREPTRTVLAPLASWPQKRRDQALARLAASARRALIADGAPPREIEVEPELELRYRGQSFEVRVPAGAGVLERFHRTHEELFGYRLPDRPVELVALRARVSWQRPLALPPRARAHSLPAAAVTGRRRATLDGVHDVPVIDRARLAPGHFFDGPALVEEYSGTSLVPPGWRARVAPGSHLVLERKAR